MTTILGLDISSVRLDACLLVPGQPPVLRHEVLGKSSEPLIERLRRIDRDLIDHMYYIGHVWKQGNGTRIQPDWFVIENAYGPSGTARKALDMTLGAIVAAVPPGPQIALLRSADWRHALGAKNTKAEGHRVVEDVLNCDYDLLWKHPHLDEHELDAIGIALGWQKILAANEAAA